ncbi:MAG TPA: prepilin-type N-terminal cleavage/methylation domain-containing protein [Verrucomicrobiae bacterium]|nr:prepilin-type N-terminal cleavage/methylation domain-containing protein [Verrucomicrobiae bacterium]
MKRPLYLANQAAPQDGFTIVELLIATVVFSMVLLVITYGVLSFTHSYFFGINSSNTQTTARTIMNGVSQAIEFSGYPVAVSTTDSGGISYFCAGGNEYVYIAGLLYKGSPSAANPGLYVTTDPDGGNSCPDPGTTSLNYTTGKELLGSNMRVTYLTVTSPSAQLYAIDLRIALGTADLLCNNSLGGGRGGCAQGAPQYSATTNVTGTDVQCNNDTGSQYCAVAGLDTTVGLRVSPSAMGS